MNYLRRTPNEIGSFEIKRAQRDLLGFIVGRAKEKLYRLVSSATASTSEDTSAEYLRRARKYQDWALISKYRESRGVKPQSDKQHHALIVCSNADQSTDAMHTFRIAKEISEYCGITILYLRGGSMIDSFLSVSEKVIDAALHSNQPLTYAEFLKGVCRDNAFTYAVVASVDASAVYRGLRESDLATIAFVHSIDTVAENADRMPEILGLSDVCAFTDPSTMQMSIASCVDYDFSQRAQLLSKQVEKNAEKDQVVSDTEPIESAHHLGDDVGDRSIGKAIHHLGCAAHTRLLSRTSDIREIRQSGCFQANFCFGENAHKFTEEEAIAQYVRPLRASTPRKPEPGFNPYIYAQDAQSRYGGTRDPYADFLAKGRPEGPWLTRVLGSDATTGARATDCRLRSALHIHSYYVEGMSDVISRLNLNRCRPDLYVSIGDSQNRDIIQPKLEIYQGEVKQVRVVPNIGRDIGPLLTEFGAELQQAYDVIGHVHLKLSKHLQGNQAGTKWRNRLMENLLGGELAGNFMDLILHEFERDPEIGIVYPAEPHAFGWLRNFHIAQDIARSMGHSQLERAIDFPAGTMFWIRSEVLRRFVNLNLSWEDYPPEPLDSDGTLLHSLERLFGVIPQLENWKTVFTYTSGSKTNMY